MKSGRISIATLMGFVGAVAVGLLALIRANELWASAWSTLALLSVGLGLIHAAFDRGRPRVFWAGFSLAGGFYLVVLYGMFSGSNLNGPRPLLSRLILVKALRLIRPDDRLFSDFGTINPPPPPVPPAIDPTAPPEPDPMASGRPPVIPLWTDLIPVPGSPPAYAENFFQVGESEFAVLIGLAGGLYALRLVARRDAREAPVAPPVSPSSP